MRLLKDRLKCFRDMSAASEDDEELAKLGTQGLLSHIESLQVELHNGLETRNYVHCSKIGARLLKAQGTLDDLETHPGPRRTFFFSSSSEDFEEEEQQLAPQLWSRGRAERQRLHLKTGLRPAQRSFK